jgi:hypothetical protein
MVVVQRSKIRNEPRASSTGQGQKKDFIHDDHKHKRVHKQRIWIFLLIFVVGLVLVLIFWSSGKFSFYHLRTNLPMIPAASVDVLPNSKPLTVNDAGMTPQRELSYAQRLVHPNVVKLQNCTVSFEAPPNMTFLPLWMPAYPGSGAASASKKGDLLKPIVDKLTGWQAGSKNYHMSIRNKLKRCHAVNSPTAVCTNGHPLTSIQPRKQAKNFHHKAIMVVRNFMTAHPAMMQDKAFAYHGAKEQIKKTEWEKLRDDWTKSSFESWKSFFVEWNSMSDVYEISMYVVYEKLMDPEVGFNVVQRLAETLRQAGLQIASDDQIPCIWYHAVVPEYQRLDALYKYVPGYTRELKTFLEKGMEKLIDEMTGKDNELVEILQEYLVQIQQNILVDI